MKEILPARRFTDPAPVKDSYLTRLLGKSIATVEEKPAAPAKEIQVRRRAKVGTDIDSMVPEMAVEAKTRLRINSAEPMKAEEIIEKRGFCVLVSDPKLMDVVLTFRVSRDDAALALDKEYAALTAGPEPKALKGE